MTKKDYVAIARAISFSREYAIIEGINRDSTDNVISFLVDRLCDVLKNDNSSFDKERFVDACGLYMNRKIDIFLKLANGFYRYECSTNAHKTCKSAKQRIMVQNCLSSEQVKVGFAEKLPDRTRVHYYNTSLPQRGCNCRLCKMK